MAADGHGLVRVAADQVAVADVLGLDHLLRSNCISNQTKLSPRVQVYHGHRANQRQVHGAEITRLTSLQAKGRILDSGEGFHLNKVGQTWIDFQIVRFIDEHSALR